mgnify:CR=1 FL=1
MAISDGYITALNPMDADKAHVFVYNSIFFSRAYDTKETIRVSLSLMTDGFVYLYALSDVKRSQQGTL